MQQPVSFGIGGGLDLVSAPLAKPPGRAISALNYEAVATGYRRLRGFERVSGVPSVSGTHNYYRVDFNNGDNQPVLGAIFRTGSPLQHFVLISLTLTSGSWAANDAAGYLIGILRQGVIASAAASTITNQTASNTIGTVVSGPTLVADSSPYTAATPALLRAIIQAVPGSGPIRGVIFLDGEIHAFRDNAGGTAGVLNKANGVDASSYESTGWEGVFLGSRMTFDSGGIDGVAAAEGTVYDTLSGVGTGSETATLYRVFVTSGSWAGGDAAGFIVTGSTTADSGDYLYVSATDGTARVLRLTSAPTTQTLPVGGRYKSIITNFFGASNLTRAYVVNGVGPAFELGQYGTSGQTTGIVSISTGMTTDTPTRVAEYRGSLFLAFPGGSVQFSTVGDPLDWNPITGSGEIGVGSEITDFATPPNSLAILSEQSIHILYGSDSSDYQLEELSDAAGALPHTAQEVGGVVYADNRGLRSLSAAQKFGNFTMGTLSRLIEPLWKKKRADGVDPSDSFVCRAADQYWLPFDDGTGLVVYLGGKEPAILPFNLGVTVTCSTSVEDDGVERLFIGCSNGFVYELNKGTSFDGAVIEHYVALAYNNMGSPQLEKRIHKAVIDVEASGTTTIAASARFNLGSVDGPDAQTLSLTTGGAAIDDLGTGESYYAGLTPAVGEVYFDGVFRDISLKISGSQASQEPHTLTGVTYLVSPRGLRR